MDESRLPEPMRRRIAEREGQPAIDIVHEFLRGEFGDAEGLDEVRRSYTRLARISVNTHRRDLAALETVLAQQHEPGTLERLVGWDANWVLDDPSEAGARVFLEEIAQMLREVIAEADSAKASRRTAQE